MEDYLKEVAYWTNRSEKFPGQSEILIPILKKYIRTFGTLHEVGCNTGKNLKAIQKVFPKLVLSGNDVSKSVKKEKVIDNVIQEDTIHFLQNQKIAFDYILTSAHLEHIPNDVDLILQKEIPKLIRKYLFVLEPDANKIGKYKKHKFGIN